MSRYNYVCKQLVPNEKIKELFFPFTWCKSFPSGTRAVAVNPTTSCHYVLSESFYHSVPYISWLYFFFFLVFQSLVVRSCSNFEATDISPGDLLSAQHHVTHPGRTDPVNFEAISHLSLHLIPFCILKFEYNRAFLMPLNHKGWLGVAKCSWKGGGLGVPPHSSFFISAPLPRPVLKTLIRFFSPLGLP